MTATEVSEGKEAPDAKPRAEINVDDFSRVVASMSRLLIGFGRLKPLRESGLGLGEWVALSILGRKEGTTNKVLGRSLGVTGQRATQITSSLLRGGLISIGPSAKGEGKKAEQKKGEQVSEIKLTDAGKTKLESINAELKPMLASALKGRALVGATKQMKSLGRIVRTEAPEKTNKRKAKKAEKKAKKAEAAASSEAAAA